MTYKSRPEEAIRLGVAACAPGASSSTSISG
jgi:hypothetical protein